MSLPVPLLHPLGSPRKPRLKHRTALIALFSLLTFTCYLLFIAYPSLDLSKSFLTHAQDHDLAHAREENHVVGQADAGQRAVPHRKAPQHLQPVPAPRPPLSLSPTEELAAVAAFIAALPHNILPSFVDPTVPLDPQLVLDFDPRSESAKEELTRVVEQVWTRFPVILFTKVRPDFLSLFVFHWHGQLRPSCQLHSSDSREVRYMLSNMHLKPAPLVVEVDQREDASVLLPLLTRLTHVPSLPILLIGGQPVGTGVSDTKGIMTEIRKLYENGELTRRILEVGAIVDFGRRKGKWNKRRRSD
ncbi:hypothetical protein J3R83DRAFT_3643 [Lanmaoa asiatica]|nr:hypothetical protein J3R83DRAFT_3643 [Lanmaoa asiatica]